MSTEKLLERYLSDVEFWAEDFAETHILIGHRESLATRYLNADQMAELDRIDRMAEAKLADHQGDDTSDVRALRRAVAFIQSERANRTTPATA